jgi:hypothetical protein
MAGIKNCMVLSALQSRMQHKATQGVTTLLRARLAEDGTVLERLLPILYEELRRTSRAYVRCERFGHTLQATALINEVFLRLVDIHQVQWRDRVRFLAAQLKRRLLVHHAHRRRYPERAAKPARCRRTSWRSFHPAAVRISSAFRRSKPPRSWTYPRKPCRTTGAWPRRGAGARSRAPYE